MKPKVHLIILYRFSDQNKKGARFIHCTQQLPNKDFLLNPERLLLGFLFNVYLFLVHKLFYQTFSNSKNENLFCSSCLNICYSTVTCKLALYMACSELVYLVVYMACILSPWVFIAFVILLETLSIKY